MPIPLGVLAVAGAGGGAGGNAYELLETISVGTAVASVEFTNVNTNYGSTYQHLQIRLTSQPVADGATLWAQLNSDTASSYNHHWLYGQGSAVTSGNGATANGVLFGGIAGFRNTHFMAAVMDILDPFETTKNTTTRTLAGSSHEIDLTSGLWRNTNAITTIKIYWTGTNMSAGSRFSLYGMRSS